MSEKSVLNGHCGYPLTQLFLKFTIKSPICWFLFFPFIFSSFVTDVLTSLLLFFSLLLMWWFSLFIYLFIFCLNVASFLFLLFIFFDFFFLFFPFFFFFIFLLLYVYFLINFSRPAFIDFPDLIDFVVKFMVHHVGAVLWFNELPFARLSSYRLRTDTK